LIFQNECLGVINVDNFKKESEFVRVQMNILEIIADHCAISIMNSRQVKVMEKQNLLLNKSIDIHKQFTKLVLENKSEDSILSMLSKLLQCNVFYSESYKIEEEFDNFVITSGNEKLGFIYYDRKNLLPLDVVAL